MLSAPSAAITIGATLRPARLAVTLSKSRHLSNKCSCEGTYTFIGNGVGKGKKITYAEAWKGMHCYLVNWQSIINGYRLMNDILTIL